MPPHPSHLQMFFLLLLSSFPIVLTAKQSLQPRVALVSPFSSQDAAERDFKTKEDPLNATKHSKHPSSSSSKPSYHPHDKPQPTYLEPPPPPPKVSSYVAPPTTLSPPYEPPKDEHKEEIEVVHHHHEDIDLPSYDPKPYKDTSKPVYDPNHVDDLDLYGSVPDTIVYPAPTDHYAPPHTGYGDGAVIYEKDLNIYQLVPLFLITTLAVIASTVVGSWFG